MKNIGAAVWDEDKMKKMKLSLAILMIQEKYYESKQDNVTKVLSLRNFKNKSLQSAEK